MLINYSINQNGGLELSTGSTPILWTDICDPNVQERDRIEKETKTSIPYHHEIHQIEYSNQFYEEDGAIYLSLSVVTKVAPVPETHMVTFILTENRLITLRYTETNPIKEFIRKLPLHQCHVKDHGELFLLLLDTMVGSTADIFELIGAETDALTLGVIDTMTSGTEGSGSEKLNAILHKINHLENISSQGSQSLQSMVLLIGYAQHREHEFKKLGLQIDPKSIGTDIHTLLKHGGFLNERLGFLLQSTLGKINMEQTYIIKTFTILAMVFMPPTLIASIYGMNFKFIPELNSPLGYPLAILAMILSGYLPSRYFKKKGWL